LDACRTFFVYETVSGHDKGLFYYPELLLLPKKSGGIWWFETGVLVLAATTYISSLVGNSLTLRQRALIHFLAYASVFHFLIYSMFSYKTPWLTCLPWAHVCLLAGLSLSHIGRRHPVTRIAFLTVALACLSTQFKQSRMATGRFASNGRNPYAYVPTQRDVESIGPWLLELEKAAPNGTIEPIGIVGTAYWPLPWYLRPFEKIGYWPSPSNDVAALPIVFATDDATVAISTMLATSHTALPRGLRDGAPLMMFVRNDIWNNWMKPADP
jgi:predicted membrane-bound mannosyltransferase